MLAALLIDEHLLAGLFGLVGVLDEVDLKLMLQELGHSLGHKLVRDGLFRLVLVARAGGEAGRDKHKAVLHVGKGDRTLVLFVQALVFSQALIWLTNAVRTARSGLPPCSSQLELW